MATVLELGKLSGHIYNPNDESYAGLKINSTSQEEITNLYKPSGWFRFTDVDPHMTTDNPFYAQLYVKFEKGDAKEAFMAVRGTKLEIIDNIWQDLSWWSDVVGEGGQDQLPAYVGNGISFYRKCCDYVRDQFPEISKVMLTGHSLGGAIAQLLTLTHCHAPVVSFNSPGCGHMPSVHKDRFNLIRNIDSHYGLINKIGLTIGHIRVVDIIEDETEAKDLFGSFNESENEAINITNKALDNYAGSSAITSGFKVAVGELKMLNLVNAVGGMDKFKNIRTRYSKCTERTESKNWYALQDSLIEAPEEQACDKQTESIGFWKVIMAQHAILNMVHALSREQYASIGTEMV